VEFSIIIPAFNEEKYLPATLRSVRGALSGLSAETIVVDNESTDETPVIAARFGAKVIPESVHNIGRVRNTGARAAQGDVLVFIDADTLVPKILFRRIADVMRKDEKCLGGAVAVTYSEMERKWMRHYLAAWRFWGKFFNMKMGAAQFCRRAVFEKTGGYDEEIFVGEDIHFYWRLGDRARRSGGYLFFIEDVQVVTSPRRFDRMSLWKTFLLTHPVYIRLNWKRKSVWKDWYERSVR
jgi:glycosyltransferase involved in cell wall biosynthesis